MAPVPQARRSRGTGPRAPGFAAGPATSRGLAVALVVAHLFASPLHAHGLLRRSSPEDGARLATVPRELRLHFTEPVALAFARIELVGPSGGPIGLGAIRHPGDSTAVLIAPIEGRLVAGSYAVSWQVVAADGHPTRGRFTFTIEPGAAGGLPASEPEPPGPEESGSAVPLPHAAVAVGTVAGDAPAESTVGEAFGPGSPLYAAVRVLTFTGLLGVIGAGMLGLVILPAVDRRHLPAAGFALDAAREGTFRFGLVAAAVLLPTAALRLAAQAVAVYGAKGAFQPERVALLLTQSVWGWGWLAQVAAAALAVVGFSRALKERTGGRPLTAIAVLSLAFTPALSGHALSAPGGPGIAVIADGVHVLGAGGWLGSLLVLACVGIPSVWRHGGEGSGQVVAAVVHAFSPTTLVFSSAVVLTGIYASWQHLGSVSALWTTEYGRTLVLKLALLSLVFAAGAYNFLRIRAVLGDEVSVRRLRRTSTVELAVGGIVVVITALLVAIPTPAGG